MKRHGNKAVEAIFKEACQLGDDEKEAFIPMDATKISRKRNRDALRLLALIKKKRNGKIKGRIVADGRKQCRYIKKEDMGSPTVYLESFLTTLVIDAYEGRYVGILDVGGAFLLSKIAEFVLVK